MIFFLFVLFFLVFPHFGQSKPYFLYCLLVIDFCQPLFTKYSNTEYFFYEVGGKKEFETPFSLLL